MQSKSNSEGDEMAGTKVPQIVLASKSRFRRELLEKTGLLFSYVNANVNESNLVGATPKETAALRAEAKANHVEAPTDAIIIGCDQVLEFQGKAYGKVKTAEEAQAFLTKISGHTHFLHSAIYVKNNQKSSTEIVTAEMVVRDLKPNEIKNYIATDEWKGCAGSYQWENRGSHLFDEVKGEATAIVGLPIVPLLKILRGFGVNLLG